MGARAALAALDPLSTAARTRRRFPYARAHTPLPPPSALSASQRAGSAFFLFRVPTLFSAGHFSSLLAAHCATRYSQRTAPRLHARTHARTCVHGRPATNDATCGPPAWLTGSLHEGGIRSVRSPLRRALLIATPIATPLQGGRPERSGLLFLKLLSRYEPKKSGFFLTAPLNRLVRDFEGTPNSGVSVRPPRGLVLVVE